MIIINTNRCLYLFVSELCINDYVSSTSLGGLK